MPPKKGAKPSKSEVAKKQKVIISPFDAWLASFQIFLPIITEIALHRSVNYKLRFLILQVADE